MVDRTQGNENTDLACSIVRNQNMRRSNFDPISTTKRKAHL